MHTIDTRHNKANEIVKYRFFELLEHSRDGKDPKTVNQYVNAVHEFEVATGFKDFRKYTSDWAITFKNYLSDKRNKRTGDNVTKSLYFQYITFVREFFEWLVTNRRDYAKIKQEDIDFLHVTRNDKNRARATNFQESHNITDILSTIRSMPETNEKEMRAKAMVSLTLLTTPIISSLQTARIQSIRYFSDYDTWALIQDPRVQNTKFAKKFISFFIGQSDDIIQNVLRWRDHLMSKGYKDKDYLFPRIATSFRAEGKAVMGLTKEPIKSQTQIRNAFTEAFTNNGLPHRKFHTFRHSVTRKMRKSENATDLLIAQAENIGQKTGMAVLVSSYAGDYLGEQAKLLKGFKLE